VAGGSAYREVKLDVHVLAETTRVVISQCLGIAESLLSITQQHATLWQISGHTSSLHERL